MIAGVRCGQGWEQIGLVSENDGRKSSIEKWGQTGGKIVRSEG